MAKSRSTDTLYLLDGMALTYRAHFAFIRRPLINSKGRNTSATYGFVGALLKLLEDERMKHIAVVFDVLGEGGTFRDEMYGEYKAHRDPPPEELVANIPSIKELVQAMDIPVIEQVGVEADDVIGTIARRAEEDGANVVIVSPDKDFQQLLSDRISMFRPAYRGDAFNRVTETTFREKFELAPDQFIDVLALMGDAADNVPGVPGIGEKTAVKLIQEYGTVENLLEHAEEISGKKAREGLLGHADDARLSKALVTIKTDLEVDEDWQDFLMKSPDPGKLRTLFQQLEFNTLADRTLRILGIAAQETKPDQGSLFDTPETSALAGAETSFDAETVEYRTIVDLQRLTALVEELKDVGRLAFDTETTSTDPMLASLVGVSLAWEPGKAAYIPTPLPDGSSTDTVLETLRPLLVSDRVLIGQHLKYDLLVLDRHGLSVEGKFFDTMVAHYLAAPEEPHGLDALALRYLGYRTIPISSLIGTGKNQRSMRDVPIEQVSPYACEDADITLRLADVMDGLLGDGAIRTVAEEIEFPLIRVLVDMERAGIRLDTEVLRDIGSGLDEDIASLEHTIYENAGRSFNIGSPQQLGEILFGELKLPVLSKTSTGKPSTREDVLQRLATEHALPALILDWRELSKLRSTYVASLGTLLHPETGRIHTSYNQTVAATGRLSSSNPNLQNIPIRTARGREIRRAFVPRAGWKMLSADYAQIELRILASLAGDESMKDAFVRGDDIHTATAAKVFHCEPAEVTRDQRRKAKEVNYGIPYGVSAFGLAQRLRCSNSEAQELIDGYQRSFPRIAGYLARQVEEAREKGYAETMRGRRRYVPDIDARNRNVRSAAERVAVNMPIQGTQADMIKIAMLSIAKRLKEEGLQATMLLQVHDELVFEAPAAELDRLETLVREEMREALPLKIPIEVGLDVGDNWLDAH